MFLCATAFMQDLQRIAIYVIGNFPKNGKNALRGLLGQCEICVS
jgi:hypothetical protein